MPPGGVELYRQHVTTRIAHELAGGGACERVHAVQAVGAQHQQFRAAIVSQSLDVFEWLTHEDLAGVCRDVSR